MRGLFWLGVIVVMAACTTQPPEKGGKISSATREVQPAPLKVPAEIDPPPVVQPGSEGPDLAPSPPPTSDPPKDTAPHS